MSYINLSFYERNIDNIITFPSFTSCSIKKDIAKMYSGRISSSTSYYCPLEKRKENGIFSILIIIDYKYKNGWEPTAFNVCEMSEYRYEKEYIFQPFSFYRIKKVDIDFAKYEADIYLENIGKKTILEKCIQNNNIIRYDKEENIIKECQEQEYSDNIKNILEKEYPLLSLKVNLNNEEKKNEENEEIKES